MAAIVRLALVGAILAPIDAPAAQPAPATPIPGLGLAALARLDELPRLRRSVSVGLVSSYDRTEGNDDGFSGKYSFLRQEGDGLVIAELTGPGVIYRFHTPTPTTDTVEFYFDGEPTARLRLPMRDLVTGSRPPFTVPLANYGVGGYFTYYPIGFARGCKIVVRGKVVQFIQINYARYGPEAAIASWPTLPGGPELEGRAREVLSRSGQDLAGYTAPPGSVVTRDRIRRVVAPGTTAPIFETARGGRIVGLKLTPASAFAGRERAAVLRAFFDGAKEPAIAAPVADLFGFAWGKPAARSLLVGTAQDTAYLYFPMPYDRSARIEISLDPGVAPLGVTAEVARVAVPRRADEGRFYAFWRRENPTVKGRPFTLLRTQGSGHIVGLALQSQGIGIEGTPFFEGDDRVAIDGDTTVRGTGSEDSFNGGWYDVPGRWDRVFSFPLSGSLGYSNAQARTGGFRLYLGDAYPYRKSVDFTIEHGEDTTNALLTDYAAVTYFYSASTPTAGPTELTPPARRVADVDKIVLNPGWVVPIQSFSLRNATLAKRNEEGIGRFLSLVADSVATTFGPHGVDLGVTTTVAGRYRVSVQLVEGPGQGILRLYDNDQPVGAEVDSYGPSRRVGPLIFLHAVQLGEGDNVLRFKLVGKHTASARLALDIVKIVLERER